MSNTRSYRISSEQNQRLDLSSWVIHFVHDRDVSNEPPILAEHTGGFPFRWDDVENSKYLSWFYSDEACDFDECATGFEVLSKIINDGYIRAGWSFRKRRPTVYGSYAAACFSEMPLYALLSYAKHRGSKKSVGAYAIALPKREFYAHGGRPAIYGTTARHTEQGGGLAAARLLADSCGIGEKEQYRYIATRLGTDRPDINWMHEREWRWSIANDKFGIPGLPIWLETNKTYSRILVVVQSDVEATKLLAQLKLQIDDGYFESFGPYDKAALINTAVISLESVRSRSNYAELRTMRLEDVPQQTVLPVKIPIPTTEYIEHVKDTIFRARRAAEQAALAYHALHPNPSSFGFAWVMIADGQSEFVEALKVLDKIHTFGTCPTNKLEALTGFGYRINAVMEGDISPFDIDEQSAAANAAIDEINSSMSGFLVYLRTHDD